MTKKIILLSTVLLFSCTALERENLSKNESDDLRQHSQVIPPQQALDNLTLLMGELYGTTTYLSNHISSLGITEQ